jgi:hypothetical protein
MSDSFDNGSAESSPSNIRGSTFTIFSNISNLLSTIDPVILASRRSQVRMPAVEVN